MNEYIIFSIEILDQSFQDTSSHRGMIASSCYSPNHNHRMHYCKSLASNDDSLRTRNLILVCYSIPGPLTSSIQHTISNTKPPALKASTPTVLCPSALWALSHEPYHSTTRLRSLDSREQRSRLHQPLTAQLVSLSSHSLTYSQYSPPCLARLASLE